MPGAGESVYIVDAIATNNAVATSGGANCQFTPGALPSPTIDNYGIPQGHYFALAAQLNPLQNGIWLNDSNGPVPVCTVGAGGELLNSSVVIDVGPNGATNAGTTYIYAAVSHNGGPGLVLQ
jgi:hypothetical protein